MGYDQLKKLNPHTNVHSSIDDIEVEDLGHFQFHDTFNNYTFSVTKKKDTTFIRPTLQDQSLIELKVGVLLPFNQNNNEWTRVMTMSGISAIRLAVAEINAQHLIPGAYITLIEKDSYPKSVEGQAAITQAVFSAISLIQEGVIGVIGDISSSWTSLSALMTSTLQIPQCSFSATATSLSDKSQFGYFFRTVPTNLLYSDAVITFIVSQGWPQLCILYSDDDFGQQLFENVVMKARRNGIHVKSYQSFYKEGPRSDIKKSVDTLAATGARVILIIAEGAAQLAAMTVASHSGYINNDTVWITIEADTDSLFAAINDFNSILEKRANGTDVVPAIYNVDSLEADGNTTTQSLMNLIDPVEYAARTSDNLEPINYNTTFSGGVFIFDVLKELPGYAPFDTFISKWSKLDPTIYPYGGQVNTNSNEALAYSCMMVMATGFNETIYTSSNKTKILKKLATGQLDQHLTPSTFNTSFVGPSGPVVLDQKGDIMSGNFKLYNIQNGLQIEIGKIIAGNMNLTSLPIYHDGTTNIPRGVPDRALLNPGYRSPVTITLLVISSIGTCIALLSMVLVLVYRKREVFKTSSPLFCVLELLGFILTYISLFFFVGYRSELSCIMIPTTFHLGYSLVLGNLIAKNYRIYRIFNNIFITRTMVTDLQLLKVSGSMLAITAVFLIAWFSSSEVSMADVPVARRAYYTDCAFEGPLHTVCVVFLVFFGALQLGFATFLSFKTRSVGRNYSKYSEYKQIGLSVYNIFFSALIGSIIFFVPTMDYYTRHYLTATMLVWATTFSLLTLFVPKLHAFFAPEKKLFTIGGKGADQSGKHLPSQRRHNTIGVSDESDHDSNENARNTDQGFVTSSSLEYDYDKDLMSLDYIMNHPQHPLNESKVKINNLSRKGKLHGMLMEVHEAEVPIQYIFKYFPFLSAWEMVSVVLMPGVSYFSFFSGKSRKGQVFTYSGSSIVASRPGEYILKVHGVNMHHVLMQVESENDLILWNDWFNTIPSTTTTTTTTSSSTNSSTIDGNNHHLIDNESFLKDTQKPKRVGDNNNHVQEHYFSSRTKEVIRSAEEDENTATNNKTVRMPTRQMRLDSGITTRHLLSDENATDDDRRGSDMTVDTLDSCYHQPVLSTSDYGMTEIIHAREVQQQRLRTHEQTLAYSRGMVLGRITEDEHRLTSSNHIPLAAEDHHQQPAFDASFASYFSAENDPTTDNTTSSSEDNSSITNSITHHSP